MSRDWRDTYEATVSLTVASLGPVQHLRVKRRDGQDGIPWEVLQAIKDELLGVDVLAVEIYPRHDDIVNELNMRHLWEVSPEIVPLLPNLAGRW